MQILTLKKKQSIDEVIWKRIDKFTIEWQLLDYNGKIIICLRCHYPRNKDQFGRYLNDSYNFEILEGNIFTCTACERHEKYLCDFEVYPTLGEKNLFINL
jgi:hypothetical protein